MPDDFDKALDDGFAAQEKALGATPDEQKPTEDNNPDKPAAGAPEPPKEDPKKDEPAETPKPEDAPKSDDAPKTEEGTKPPEAPKTEEPEKPAEPTPLTEDGVRKILTEMRDTERNSGRELQTVTQQVLDQYYPEGLSNVLVDEKTGKELRTPADVQEAARANGSEMTTDEAHQWLLNEQYKLDNKVAEIKGQAEKIAETTLTFTKDSLTALEKYEPLFKAYPHLQKKVYDKLMQQVKYDENKGVILSAPDVLDHYDFYLEAYQTAFEASTGQSATNPTPAPGAPAPAPAPATPTADDRLDEGGDGGTTEVDDPNNFAQQVTKELNKGL